MKQNNLHDYALGRQLTIEYYDCDSKILANTEMMEEIFKTAAKASGATIISSNFHGFTPQGVSGVVIIAESHFTVHAWPEHDYAAVDIFTCGESISFDVAVAKLKELLKSDNAIISSVMNRGIVSNNGIERLVPIFEDVNHRYSLSWESRFKSTNAKALLVSVDVYHIFENNSFNITETDNFVKNFLTANLGFSENSKIEVKDDFERNIITINIFDKLNTLQVKLFKDDNSAYMDLFSCDYIEPRLLGEFATEYLKGSNYRMQVAIRQ